MYCRRLPRTPRLALGWRPGQLFRIISASPVMTAPAQQLVFRDRSLHHCSLRQACRLVSRFQDDVAAVRDAELMQEILTCAAKMLRALNRTTTHQALRLGQCATACDGATDLASAWSVHITRSHGTGSSSVSLEDARDDNTDRPTTPWVRTGVPVWPRIRTATVRPFIVQHWRSLSRNRCHCPHAKLGSGGGSG